MAARFAPTPGRRVIKYATVVKVLDAAYRGELEPLNMLLYGFLHGDDPHVGEIINNALFAISEIMRKTHEPSITLAPKIGGIVRNHRNTVWKRETKAHGVLSGTDDHRISDVPDFTHDPAAALVRMERIRELTAIHDKIGEDNPRRFEIIVGDLMGAEAGEHLKDVLGEDLEPATIRQSRKRAHDHAKNLRAKPRKDDQS
jgi:hypothetical protein